MSGFDRQVSAFFNNLSIPNLIRLFLFLFLLLSIPLTAVAVKTSQDLSSRASGWSISLSVGVCNYSTKRADFYSTTTIPAGYEKGYMNFYANGNLFTQNYDTYPGHADVRQGSAGSVSVNIYATLRDSGSGSVRATSNTVTIDCSVPPCSSDCPSTTARQCASGGAGYQTCGYVGSCLKWSAATSCPAGQTCSSGNCITSGGGTSGGGTSGGGTSGGGTSGGKKTGGTGSTGQSYLETLQLEVSVPYLVGSMKLKVEVGGVTKEIEVSPTNKTVTLDLKGTNLSLNKEYILVVTSDKALVKKVSFTPTASSFNVDAGNLILGDLNQDNKIDSKDQLELIKSISAQTAVGDLNADKDTDSLDWAILLTNFGKKGD